jgi:hypothetical protein
MYFLDVTIYRYKSVLKLKKGGHVLRKVKAYCSICYIFYAPALLLCGRETTKNASRRKNARYARLPGLSFYFIH